MFLDLLNVSVKEMKWSNDSLLLVYLTKILSITQNHNERENVVFWKQFCNKFCLKLYMNKLELFGAIGVAIAVPVVCGKSTSSQIGERLVYGSWKFAIFNMKTLPPND